MTHQTPPHLNPCLSSSKRHKHGSINKINIWQSQLKTFVSSKALFQVYTNHNLKYFLWTYSTQQLVSSECVCSPALFLLLYKIDIMRKQVLTLTLNQPRKVLSSFNIWEMWLFIFMAYLCLFALFALGKFFRCHF